MAPTVSNIYPSDTATGVPIGIDILITFDSEIDEETARNNIMVFGADFDETSGPDSVKWVDPAIGYNPYFLNSPGFNGDLRYDMYFELLNSDNTVFSGLDYESGSPNYKTRVRIKPKKPLAPSTIYKVYVIGNSDSSDGVIRGIASRTVYSTTFGANLGSGNCVFRGGYRGDTEDTVTIEITEAGNIGTAEYIWYLASNPSLVYSGVTSRKYRSLTDMNIDVRFTGSDFNVGDKFSVKIYPPEYMEDSFLYSFTTGTGNISAIPTTTSTSVLGDIATSSEITDEFEVTYTDPETQAMKQSINIRVIKVVFSNNIDASTINDKTVKVEATSAVGYDPTTTNLGKLNKFLYVDGKNLYILLQTGEE